MLMGQSTSASQSPTTEKLEGMMSDPVLGRSISNEINVTQTSVSASSIMVGSMLHLILSRICPDARAASIDGDALLFVLRPH